MTTATVKTVAKRFLATTTPEVLVVKGAWGVGKTYAWNQLVQEFKNQIGLPNYCYVSLFGIGSLSELRMAIFAKTRPVNQIGKNLDTATNNKEWISLAWGGLRSVFLKTRDVPFFKNLSIGIDAIAPYLIGETVICLDDFERLNDTSIKPDELLGFISSLKEEKGCKIVLIFNEQELKSKLDVYKQYREKIIDIEILFDPSAEEAAELAFPPDLPFREQVKRYATSLGIKNIRILRKIVDLIGLIFEELDGTHEGVQQQAISTIVLVSWCYFDTNSETPRIDFVLKWNKHLWGLGEDDGKDESPQQIKWKKSIQDYGLTHMDEFDYAISKVIERGYIEETGLSVEAVKLDAQFRENDLRNSFSDAWNLFHYTFADNKEHLIHALNDSFRKSVHTIDPINLNGTVRLLRELDRNDVAEGLLDFYIQERGGEEKLFDLDNYPFASDIKDKVLRERFSQQQVISQKLPSLLDAVKEISQNHGWSKLQIASLEQATEDDFYNLFLHDHGKDLSRIVRACIQFEGYPEHETIGKKARAAITRIGKGGQLNAIRVSRFGIKVS